MAAAPKLRSGATYPHHVHVAADIEGLAAIREPDVTLALLERRPPFTIGRLDGLDTLSFTASADAVGAPLRNRLVMKAPCRWYDPLIADVAALARTYASLMRLDWVAVRLDRVTGDACWRFHADYVSVRLITTYQGQGTQWLDQAAARRLADGGAPTPHQLATGTVGLFKGRLLAPDTAIVHRSPPIAGTGEERLLLVIDPAGEGQG